MTTPVSTSLSHSRHSSLHSVYVLVVIIPFPTDSGHSTFVLLSVTSFLKVPSYSDLGYFGDVGHLISDVSRGPKKETQ